MVTHSSAMPQTARPVQVLGAATARTPRFEVHALDDTGSGVTVQYKFRCPNTKCPLRPHVVLTSFVPLGARFYRCQECGPHRIQELSSADPERLVQVRPPPPSL
jgi:hypothetical protein